MTPAFTLDSRLAADTVAVTDLPLSAVRLMNDATYWASAPHAQPRRQPP